jgi:hypothetical protein
MGISRQPFPIKMTRKQKQLENVEAFKYFGRILTNDVRFVKLNLRLPLQKLRSTRSGLFLQAHWI